MYIKKKIAKYSSGKVTCFFYTLTERDVLITAVPRHVGILDGSQPCSRPDDLLGEIHAHYDAKNRQHHR